MRIGELARLSGVSTDTIRHYEARGVLAEAHRSSNGYREFGADAVPNVLALRGALGVGFTLEELAEIVRERERGGAPCRRVRNLAVRKLASIDARLTELTGTRDDLRRLIGDWDRRLARTPAGKRAGLIESLGTRSNSGCRRAMAPRFSSKRPGSA